mgnify:CR=1 FL=1
MRHSQERRTKMTWPRDLHLAIRRWRILERGAARFLRLDGDLSPWERRRMMKPLALTSTSDGPRLARLARHLRNRRGAIVIWVLQKNSGVPKRVRAVAASDVEMLELDACNHEFENSALYVWHGHELLGRHGWPARGTAPTSVHALVHTARVLHEPGIESQVCIDAVYAERSAAERAVAARRRSLPESSWAVITYPVGTMLF